jgi:hypothetical protein
MLASIPVCSHKCGVGITDFSTRECRKVTCFPQSTRPHETAPARDSHKPFARDPIIDSRQPCSSYVISESEETGWVESKSLGMMLGKPEPD